MLVSKKADRPGEPEKYRLVINYQELKKLTVASEVPNITAIMEQLQGAKYFTILDMKSGFTSPTLEQHVEDVRVVLHVLREHTMYPKISKRKFARTELEYLGFIAFDGAYAQEGAFRLDRRAHACLEGPQAAAYQLHHVTATGS
ncbi:hypothetical protein Esti_003171 [Eimeria stiedai]